jgi:hypothetical protein
MTNFYKKYQKYKLKYFNLYNVNGGSDIEVLYSFFNPKLVEQDKENHYIIKCDTNDSSTIIINDNHIQIEIINKCDTITGTEFVRKIIEIGRSLKKE